MIRLLVRKFIKNSENTSDPDVREGYGTLASVVGVALNILLFCAKYIAGVITGSIAITADAFNNLSDASSSLITMFGFKLAGKKPHSDHPFGHGRWEYIVGLIVSMLIIHMGLDLLTESISKIIHPEETEFSILSASILVISILVKIYMNRYNTYLSKKIDSVAIAATATDSLSDACATAMVLISMLITHFWGLKVDGIAGGIVALMILWAGFNAAKDTISPLLGAAPDPELVKKITEMVLTSEGVTGMHDLVIHDYGVGRRMISLHAEVPADGDIIKIHDMIDLVERRLSDELRCHAVIHMDPIATDDSLTNSTKIRILTALRAEMGEDITIHDFRMVTGPTHTNVIFDAVIHPDSAKSAAAVKKRIEGIVSAMDGSYNAVVTIDFSYLG